MASASPAAGYTYSEPYDSGYLPVGSLHAIYYTQWGNPAGKPALFLHGGPGGFTSAANCATFDPSVYRVVCFDQRGAGQSKPSGCMDENRASDLLADAERLRTHVDVARWHVVLGGSWGSCFALLYAQAHPEAVARLVLRGVFTYTAEELRWTRGSQGAARIRPEEYERWLSHLPAEDRDSPMLGYRKLLFCGDGAVERAAAVAYCRWGSAIGRLLAESESLALLDPSRTWSFARIESSYHTNLAWLNDSQAIMRPENLERIKRIPCSIVQGRYDICCTPKVAWELHKALPESTLFWIQDAGHAATEPGTLKKTTEVCDEYAKIDS